MNTMNVRGENNLPEGMTIERNPGEIAIEIYDAPQRIPRLFMLWGTPLMVLVIAPWLLVNFGNIEIFAHISPVRIGLILCVISIPLYISSFLGLNKTRITKRSGMIEILYGPIPVPWRPRARSFRVDEITHINKEDSVLKGVVRRGIFLTLKDSTKFFVGRWPIPVSEIVEQQLRPMIDSNSSCFASV